MCNPKFPISAASTEVSTAMSGCRTKVSRMPRRRWSALAALCCLFVTTEVAAVIVSAIQPAVRSVEVNGRVTVFSTLINTSSSTAADCQIRLENAPEGIRFLFFETDAQNHIVGEAGSMVDLAPDSHQTFLIEISSQKELAPTELFPTFTCRNQAPAAFVSGVNSLTLTASSDPTMDVIISAATPSRDGILYGTVGEPGAFALAAVNIGISGRIRAQARGTGAASEASLLICQTDSATGTCLVSPPQTQVSADLQKDIATTWTVIAQSGQPVLFRPDESRIAIEFFDERDFLVGSSSIAFTASETVGISNGVGDNADAFPDDPREESDRDGDGVGDNADAFPDDPLERSDRDNDGVGDNADAFPDERREWSDRDGDGVGDNADDFPDDPLEWSDLDGDGISDNADALPYDPREWSDRDGDGVGDNADAFPDDPGERWDRDGDGVGDDADVFPNDPRERSDRDGDGVGDNADAFPDDPREWRDRDGDGIGDNADAFPGDSRERSDRDGDGVGDNADAFPDDRREWRDRDGDGVGDNADAFRNDPHEWSDRDGDGVGDQNDCYPDNPTRSSGEGDSDCDLVPDHLDTFPNNPNESSDIDGDGVGDNSDLFISDSRESYDSDDDKIGDNADNCPNVVNYDQHDTDGDGLGDACDEDDDNDQINDRVDNCPLVPNPQQTDSRNDGIADTCRVYVVPATAAISLLPGESIITNDLTAISAYNRPLTLIVSTEPTFGSVTIDSNTDGGYTYTYTTTQTEAVSDRFEVVATDGEFRSIPATITVFLNTDPLYEYQWHLENVGRNGIASASGVVGEDLRLLEPVRSGLTGEGITVGIVESGGFDIYHPDLIGRVINSKSSCRDFVDTSLCRHGTAMAGIIAASGWNGIGGRGIAPKVLLKRMGIDGGLLSSHLDVDIINGSLVSGESNISGWADIRAVTEMMPRMRKGKGALLVTAAGNERWYSAADPVNHYPQTIVVPALADNGKRARSSSWGGASWISGFSERYEGNDRYLSGIMTTNYCDQYLSSMETFIPIANREDICDSSYTIVGGTSAATAMISGALALVLEANENLSWRDVKYILAKTARHVDVDFEPVSVDNMTYFQWVENAAGFKHHDWYGFGAMDTTAAVRMARQWKEQGVPAERLGRLTRWDSPRRTLDIELPRMQELKLPMAVSESGIIEFVSVQMSVGMHRAGRIPSMRLESPSGTVATLQTPTDGDMPSVLERAAGDGRFRRASAAFFNEEIAGTWTLRLFDHDREDAAVELDWQDVRIDSNVEQTRIYLDWWEIQFHYMDTADNDADGIQNAFDKCPDIASSNQLDEDGDNVGDICDDFPMDPNRSDRDDYDDDGVPDTSDTCPKDINQYYQLDSDGDGIGNVCDRYPSNPFSYAVFEPGREKPHVDNDGDGIWDGWDKCPDVPPLELAIPDPTVCAGLLPYCRPGPSHIDADNDGIGRECDIDDHDRDKGRNPL